MERSKLEIDRERAAYDSDVDSIASSRKSGDYDADDILAQRIHYQGGEDIVQYLVKYTDYPMYRCEWIPRKGISPVLYEKWQKKRESLGDLKIREQGDQKQKEFNEARQKADATHERRRQRREKRRKEAEMTKEAELKRDQALRQKEMASKIPPTSSSKTITGKGRREVLVSSEEDSASSSSDGEPLFLRYEKAKNSTRRAEHEDNNQGQSRPSSPQPRRESLAVMPPLQSDERRTSKHDQHSKQGSSAQASLSTANKNMQETSSLAIDRRKSAPTGPVINTDQTVLGVPGPIKIVNQPKHPQRRPWDTHNKHFNKMKYVGLAEKRGRAEGTPDFAELEFVNGTPSGLSKKTVESGSRTRVADDPYSRREPGRRRLQDLDPDEDLSPTTKEVPLRSYEMGKIPLTCFNWKHNNSCEFTAEQCRFLHRERDQDGKPLVTTNWDGRVPPKYRDPPETCWFWFKEGSCAKPADECIYAHENTGTLSTCDGKTVSIDPNDKPREKQATSNIGPKHSGITCWFWLRDKIGCMKSAEQCQFAHTNTGLLGNTAGAAYERIDLNERPVSELAPPRSVTRPSHRFPPLTCFFWLRGEKGCNLAAERCQYAHENTGWLASFGSFGSKKTEQIDPNEKPRYPSFSMTSAKPGISPPKPNLSSMEKTCFYWNEGLCNQSDTNCLFLHRYTGMVAEPPRSWHRPSGWQRHFRDDPALMIIDEPTPTLANDPTPRSLFPHRVGNGASEHVDHPTTDHLSTSLHDSDKYQTTVISTNDMKAKLEAALKIDFDDMFRCNGDSDADIITERNALVLYDPEEHKIEHELITRWLLINHVDVYNFWLGSDGGWNTFRERIVAGGSGVIIAHPDFEGYSGLPGFGDVLRGTVRLWSVGYQEGVDYSIWDSEASPTLHYDRFQIFPHGGVIYITDDVFEKKPQLALKIFELFFAKIEAGRKVDSDIVPGMYIDDGLLLWRIGVRPDLMKWIGDTCQNHQTELDAGDADFISLEKLYVLLTDNGYIEPDSTLGHPADNRRLDYFPVISSRKDLAESMGLYYDARKRSLHDANTDMAHHYSGLVIMERRLYRQYFVVHTAPEVVDWKDEITNIDEIMTPEKCIWYFEQEAKGNRFDNYEWAYPEKRMDSFAA